MEYFLSRALEVCRLSEGQLYQLQEQEKSPLNRCHRCLFAFEIQDRFALSSLKEHYEIPTNNDAAQSSHNQHLRSMFREAGLYPADGDLSAMDIDEVHAFDDRVREADQNLKIDLKFSTSNGSKRRRTSDEL